MGLNAIGDEAIEVNTAKGWPSSEPSWWDDRYKIPAHLALIHSEVSEALKAFRIRDEANFAEELADVAIRLTSFGRGLGIDLDGAVREKLGANRQRAYQHGGKSI